MWLLVVVGFGCVQTMQGVTNALGGSARLVVLRPGFSNCLGLWGCGRVRMRVSYLIDCAVA